MMTTAIRPPSAGETLEQALRRFSANGLRQGFALEGVFPYATRDGDILFWRIRLKHPDGKKKFPAFHWDGQRYEPGERPAPPEGKPLYRWPELLTSRSPVVVVVEGETKADALIALGGTATTSGGAKTAHLVNWAPIQGRTALMWRDNDASGLAYAREATHRLQALGVSVTWIDVAALDLPVGGDVIDWLARYADATWDDVLALPRIPAVDTAADTQRRSTEIVRSGPEVPLTEDRDPDAPRLILYPASRIKPVPIEWLWPGWLAAGKLILLAGQPGTGKTTIACDLASILSRGGLWPDGTQAAVGEALIWMSEDDARDTIRPRLIAAEADCGRIFLPGVVVHRTKRRIFDPAKDIPLLREELRRMRNPRLIVIDPVIAVVPGDSHKNADVRRGLQPLVDLGREFRCAVVGIAHLTKGSNDRDLLERVSGSLAYAALPRIVLFAAALPAAPGEEARSLFLRAKSNIGPTDGGFVYRRMAVNIQNTPRIEASRIVWDERVDGDAALLLSEGGTTSGGPEAREASLWLREVLAEGPKPIKQLQREASEAGFSWRTVERARTMARVEFVRGGPGRPGCWRLPANTGRCRSVEADRSPPDRYDDASVQAETMTRNDWGASPGAHAAWPFEHAPDGSVPT